MMADVARPAPTPTPEEFIAPPGGVIAGQAYLLSLQSQLAATTREQLVVASDTVGEGVLFHALMGVVEYAKPHEEPWTTGDVIYWDASGGCMTTTPTTPSGSPLLRVGVAEVDAPRPSVTGLVLLDPPPPRPEINLARRGMTRA